MSQPPATRAELEAQKINLEQQWQEHTRQLRLIEAQMRENKQQLAPFIKEDDERARLEEEKTIADARARFHAAQSPEEQRALVADMLASYTQPPHIKITQPIQSTPDMITMSLSWSSFGRLLIVVVSTCTRNGNMWWQLKKPLFVGNIFEHTLNDILWVIHQLKKGREIPNLVAPAPDFI